LTGLYKPRTDRTGLYMNHALAVLATLAVYCIHGMLYTKQGAVKLSSMLVNSTHHPNRMPNTHWPSKCSNL